MYFGGQINPIKMKSTPLASLMLILVFSLPNNYLLSQNSEAFNKALKLYNEAKYEEAILFCDLEIKKLLLEPNIDSLEIANQHIYFAASHYQLNDNEKCIEIANRGINYCTSNDEGKIIQSRLLYRRSFSEYFLNKPYQSYESKKQALNLLKSVEHPDMEYLVGV